MNSPIILWFLEYHWIYWINVILSCKKKKKKQVYYQGWNRLPAQVGCMRQVLGPGALGRPRGIGWRGRWEGGSGWGTHVNPWLIHVSVWQKPLQYCKVISLQLIKTNRKKKKHFVLFSSIWKFFSYLYILTSSLNPFCLMTMLWMIFWIILISLNLLRLVPHSGYDLCVPWGSDKNVYPVAVGWNVL